MFRRVAQGVRATRMWAGVERPSWPLNAAIMAGLIVITAVALVFVVPAVIVAAAVYVVAFGVLKIRKWITGVLHQDGRRNVRVLARRD